MDQAVNRPPVTEGNTMDLAGYFSKLRSEYPSMSASQAILWARSSVEVDAIAARIDWLGANDAGFELRPYGPFTVGRLADEGIEIRVFEDDEAFDWGDCEPSDFERENLQVIGVAVGIVGDDEEALDALWGVSYFDGDYERMAIETAVSNGMLDTARETITARALAAAISSYIEN